MACKRVARRKSSNWCFFGNTGASPSWRRELAFTGHDRAGIGTGSRLAFRGGRSSRSQRSDETTRRCAGSGRRVAESWSGCERRRRGKIAGEGDVEGEAERKRKDWLERERNERNRKEAPPKRSGRNNKGLDGGGIGRALGRSAARVRERPPGRTQSAQFGRVATGKITPARAPGRWAPGWVWGMRWVR